MMEDFQTLDICHTIMSAVKHCNSYICVPTILCSRKLLIVLTKFSNDGGFPDTRHMSHLEFT